MLLLVAIETIKTTDGADTPTPSAASEQGLASETWTLLQRLVISQRSSFIAAARELDLIPPHVIALQTLDKPTPMGKLAEVLGCDKSNVTGITDRLEERGLVERRADEHDRRVKLLVLTPEGRRVREQIHARVSAPPPLMEALSPDDLRTMRDILQRAVDQLEG
jgi:DNA-binding MarR family transcriptional regulator